jgi:hypothetical protein
VNEAWQIPRVAMDAKGNAIAVWADCDGTCPENWVKYSFRPAGGSFGPPVKLARGTSLPEVVMSRAGEAAIYWAGDSFEPRLFANIVAFIRPPGGSFGPPEPIQDAGTPEHPHTGAAENPRAAYDDAGNLFVAWRGYHVNESTRLEGKAMAAVRRPGKPFDMTYHVLSRTDLNVWPLDVAAAGEGRALVTWPLGVFGSHFWVQAAEAGPGLGGGPGGDAPQPPPPSSPPEPPPPAPGESGGGDGAGAAGPGSGDSGGGGSGAGTGGGSGGDGGSGTGGGSGGDGPGDPGARSADAALQVFVPRPPTLRGFVQKGVVVRVRSTRSRRARVAITLGGSGASLSGARTLAASRPMLRRGVMHLRLRPAAAGRRAVLARAGAGLGVVAVAGSGADRARAALPFRLAAGNSAGAGR